MFKKLDWFILIQKLNPNYCLKEFKSINHDHIKNPFFVAIRLYHTKTVSLISSAPVVQSMYAKYTLHWIYIQLVFGLVYLHQDRRFIIEWVSFCCRALMLLNRINAHFNKTRRSSYGRAPSLNVYAHGIWPLIPNTNRANCIHLQWHQRR